MGHPGTCPLSQPAFWGSDPECLGKYASSFWVSPRPGSETAELVFGFSSSATLPPPLPPSPP